MPSDEVTEACCQKLRDVLDRVMHVWALIKMVPEHHLADLRQSLESELLQHKCLVESELMVIGLKHLHRLNGPDSH